MVTQNRIKTYKTIISRQVLSIILYHLLTIMKCWDNTKQNKTYMQEFYSKKFETTEVQSTVRIYHQSPQVNTNLNICFCKKIDSDLQTNSCTVA